MARPRQPIGLVEAKGKKHLTKAEIEERRATEPQIFTDGIEAPKYLTKKQRDAFDLLARQLQKINIMGETDVDTLARYVTAQSQYEAATKDLRALQKQKPKEPTDGDPEEDAKYMGALGIWLTCQENLDKRVDRYFKQAQTAAAALGLTISSRCKLVVPVKSEPEKVNKFAKFGEAARHA